VVYHIITGGDRFWNLVGKYNYYKMKYIGVQDDQYIQRSNLGRSRIFRASTEIPNGQSLENRTDVELLFESLPEPIDLELDVYNRMLYWTDRGDPPRGNTVNRASVDGKSKNQSPEILLTHLMEGIGIALDLKGERMFVTDLGGSIYSAKLDGSDKKTLLYAQGNLTGIAYAELGSRLD